MELKELLKALCQIINIGGKVFEDKQVGISDLSQIFALFDVLKQIPGIDFEKVPAELAQLNEAGMKELHAVLVAELELPQEEAEKKIEIVFAIGVELFAAGKAIAELVQELKK